MGILKTSAVSTVKRMQRQVLSLVPEKDYSRNSRKGLDGSVTVELRVKPRMHTHVKL